MDKKNKDKYGVRLDADEYLSQNSVASVHECTGIAPGEIMNDSEAESYTQIYNIPINKIDKQLKHKKK